MKMSNQAIGNLELESRRETRAEGEAGIFSGGNSYTLNRALQCQKSKEGVRIYWGE